MLLTTGRSDVFVTGVTSAEPVAFGRSMIARLDVDWPAHGYDKKELDALVEFGLRLIQSLVLEPPTAKGPRALRSFPERWVVPAVRAPAKHVAAAPH